MPLDAASRLLRRGFGASSGPLWGEDLAVDPFTAAFAPRRWAETDDDELVFYIPSLALPCLQSRLRLTALLGDAAWRLEAARTPADVAARRAGLLARAHAALLSPVPGLDEGEAALAGFVARVNPAYLDPALACLQETGALCAWLGIVAGGRDALLPPCLAEPLAEACGAWAGGGLHGGAAAFARAVGSRRLYVAAERAQARRAPVRVRGCRSPVGTFAAAQRACGG